MLTQANPARVETPWDWITISWRGVHPYLDPTKCGDSLKWKDLRESHRKMSHSSTSI